VDLSFVTGNFNRSPLSRKYFNIKYARRQSTLGSEQAHLFPTIYWSLCILTKYYLRTSTQKYRSQQFTDSKAPGNQREDGQQVLECGCRGVC
jgi:hypothetical protein